MSVQQRPKLIAAPCRQAAHATARASQKVTSRAPLGAATRRALRGAGNYPALARMHTCTHAHMQTCMHACMFCVHGCMGACVHACVHAHKRPWMSPTTITRCRCRASSSSMCRGAIASRCCTSPGVLLVVIDAAAGSVMGRVPVMKWIESRKCSEGANAPCSTVGPFRPRGPHSGTHGMR